MYSCSSVDKEWITSRICDIFGVATDIIVIYRYNSMSFLPHKPKATTCSTQIIPLPNMRYLKNQWRSNILPLCSYAVQKYQEYNPLGKYQVSIHHEPWNFRRGRNQNQETGSIQLTKHHSNKNAPWGFSPHLIMQPWKGDDILLQCITGKSFLRSIIRPDYALWRILIR